MSPRIAIVGIACRYPGARSPTQLWENVLAQRRAFRRFPSERLRLADYFSEDAGGADTTYSAEAALIEGYEFDRVRFRVAGNTFRAVDMAHWLALEVAADALADAGFADGEGLPRETCGVLVGNTLTGEFSRANLMRLRWPYVRRAMDAELSEQGWSLEDRAAFLDRLEVRYKSPFPPVGDESLAGGLSNTIAGRICNHFDFQGGGYTVDGACASSLLALATGCSALIAGDLDVAVVGGVDLSLDPFELVGFARLGALAAQEMRVFDARPTGFLPGEGCGFVVLMRCEDALEQRHRVYAAVRGWGVSSDGSGGITRPEVAGQMLALRHAYQRAGFGIETVPYFEGHGTGTGVGDPTELQALSRALRETAGAGQRPAVGSIKANIGHTKAAAGIAGIIKATMALQNQLVPPGTGWNAPHPILAEEGNLLRLLREGEAWPTDQPLRAGVSAMGFGGINAHAVLESTAVRRRAAVTSRERMLLASPQDKELFSIAGNDIQALSRQVEQLQALASRLSSSELTDLACQLATNVRTGPVRAAVVASRPLELEQGLRTLSSWLAGGVRSRLDLRGGVMLGSGAKPPVFAFLFPGQGSPAHLDGGLWVRRFEQVRDRYARANLPLDSDGIATEVAQLAITRAALSGLSVLDRLGIEAAVAIGHSMGELIAYHWAHAMDEEQLLRVVAARGRAIADFGRPGGAMAGVAADQETVTRLLEGLPAVIAGLNSPKQTVVSGDTDAVDAVVSRAQAAGVAAKKLPVSHAFHSSLVADAAPAFARALAAEELRPLQAPVVSTITGTTLEPAADLRDLLFRQMTSPVRFMDAVQAAADRVDLWIEVGPGNALRGIASQLVDHPIVSLDAGGDSLRGLLITVGAAFVLGARLNHQWLFEDRFSRPFDLESRPGFLASPCELAPEPSHTTRPAVPNSDEREADAAPQETTSRPADATPLQVVRDLAAKRAELPLSSVTEHDRLLSDLHLSSLSVGQLVAEASRALGFPPPASLTEAADATVGQLAELLEQIAQDQSAQPAHVPETLPAGVDTWTRAFTVELVERRLPKRQSRTASGRWQVIAADDYPLRDALQHAFDDGAAGQGVVVCLPPDPDERHLDDLLAGAQAVLAQEADAGFVLVQHGGGGAGFARSLCQELPHVTTCVVDVPQDHPQAIEWVLAESQSAVGYAEAYYDETGRRRESVLRLLPLPEETPSLPLDPEEVLLVTGGGKGIAAECAFALAKEVGARLAVLGRSRPSEDTELAANLERLAAAEIDFRYLAADVTDAEQVRSAVQEVQAQWGPVRAVLHAAGNNNPKRLELLDKKAFLQTLRPKLDGARNVLSAIDPEQLRLLITFGSIIARSGMRGQADYALANEWLTRLTERWSEEHPHCHCLAAEWSVWSGVGMGERLGTMEALKQQGIRPISPDEGIAMLRHLVGQSVPSVGVVVTGRFGDPPTLKLETQELPLLRFLERPRVYVPGVELVVEADLSADTDPYLNDHVFQGATLLPAVMGLEAMAQVAMALTGSSQLPVFEEVAFQHPISVPDGEKVTIRLAALARTPHRIEVVLRSQETGFQMDHFRATCRFGQEVAVEGACLEEDAVVAGDGCESLPSPALRGRPSRREGDEGSGTDVVVAGDGCEGSGADAVVAAVGDGGESLPSPALRGRPSRREGDEGRGADAVVAGEGDEGRGTDAVVAGDGCESSPSPALRGRPSRREGDEGSGTDVVVAGDGCESSPSPGPERPTLPEGG